MTPTLTQEAFVRYALQTWGRERFQHVTDWVLATNEEDRMDPMRSGHMLTLLRALGEEQFRTLIRSTLTAETT